VILPSRVHLSLNPSTHTQSNRACLFSIAAGMSQYTHALNLQITNPRTPCEDPQNLRPSMLNWQPQPCVSSTTLPTSTALPEMPFNSTNNASRTLEDHNRGGLCLRSCPEIHCVRNPVVTHIQNTKRRGSRAPTQLPKIARPNLTMQVFLFFSFWHSLLPVRIVYHQLFRFLYFPSFQVVPSRQAEASL